MPARGTANKKSVIDKMNDFNNKLKTLSNWLKNNGFTKESRDAYNLFKIASPPEYDFSLHDSDGDGEISLEELRRHLGDDSRLMILSELYARFDPEEGVNPKDYRTWTSNWNKSLIRLAIWSGEQLRSLPEEYRTCIVMPEEEHNFTRLMCRTETGDWALSDFSTDMPGSDWMSQGGPVDVSVRQEDGSVKSETFRSDTDGDGIISKEELVEHLGSLWAEKYLELYGIPWKALLARQRDIRNMTDSGVPYKTMEKCYPGEDGELICYENNEWINSGEYEKAMPIESDRNPYKSGVDELSVVKCSNLWKIVEGAGFPRTKEGAMSWVGSVLERIKDAAKSVTREDMIQANIDMSEFDLIIMEKGGAEQLIASIPEIDWSVKTDESGQPIANAFYNPGNIDLPSMGWMINADVISTSPSGHGIAITWEFLRSICLKTEGEMGFILGHELAHGVLDHWTGFMARAAKLQKQITEKGPIVFQGTESTYTVKSGDTLHTIGQNILKSNDENIINNWIAKVVEKNKFRTSWKGVDNLEVGQTLYMPPWELTEEDAFETAQSVFRNSGETVFSTELLKKEDELKSDLLGQLYTSKAGMPLADTSNATKMMQGFLQSDPVFQSGNLSHPDDATRWHALEAGADHLNYLKVLEEECGDGDNTACIELENLKKTKDKR